MSAAAPAAGLEGSARPGFRPDIEGLRAVAILAVVAFHASLRGGGFVGVDVFFVVSGFLITRLLWAEVTATGGVRLVRFYAARARRLLPASATVLVVTAVVAAWLLPPLRVPAVLGDALAGALYVVNYRFAVNGTEYLVDHSDSPFQHYWSLSVEEQFYLLWPVLLLAAVWLRRRRSVPSVRPYWIGLAGVAVASFIASLLWTHSAPPGGVFLLPPWAFFSLPTRAWELAVGGLVALAVPTLCRIPASVARAAGVAGLAAIGVAVFGLGTATPYPGVAALLPVLGTALVIGAGCALPSGGAARVLSSRPLRPVGRVSYSWYLWHWPLLIFVPLLIPQHRLAVAVAVVASYGLAVLTERYVERPLRYSPALRRSSASSLAMGAAATDLAAGVAVALAALVVIPVGPGDAAASIDTDSVAEFQAAVEAAAHQRALPMNLDPQLADVAEAVHSAQSDVCVDSWRDVEVGDCISGDPGGRQTVALVGDSHAAMWRPGLEDAARQHNWRLMTMAKNTCPLPDRPIYNPFLGRRYVECEQWRDNVIERLAEVRPAVVVVSVSRRYGSRWGLASSGPQWDASLSALIDVLRARTGAAVVVLGPVPDPHTDVPVCLSAHVDDISVCAPQRDAAVKSSVIAAEERATRAVGGRYVDVSDLFCTSQTCPAVVGRYLVFRDDNHLSAAYAGALAGVLGGTLAEVMARPR
ncbi:acyltransferase [Mycobacterium sp. shizuoka-1]|nr:acyltransferase family protein [Mycobacterium sp. shizuoka-1]GAY14030.1 acyltransferase [Mycobacterium sp. shizuoka-1]